MLAICYCHKIPEIIIKKNKVLSILVHRFGSFSTWSVGSIVWGPMWEHGGNKWPRRLLTHKGWGVKEGKRRSVGPGISRAHSGAQKTSYEAPPLKVPPLPNHATLRLEAKLLFNTWVTGRPLTQCHYTNVVLWHECSVWSSLSKT